MTTQTYSDQGPSWDIHSDDPLPAVPLTPADQSKRERTLATLYTQCPEISDLLRGYEGQDATALVAMMAMARCAAADPIEFRWEIGLCADVLRQRVRSGQLGERQADMNEEHRNNPPRPVHRIFLKLTDQINPEARKRLRQFGFSYDSKEEQWWGFDSPRRRQVAEEIKTQQGALLEVKE